jgi:hypothetical protein
VSTPVFGCRVRIGPHEISRFAIHGVLAHTSRVRCGAFATRSKAQPQLTGDCSVANRLAVRHAADPGWKGVMRRGITGAEPTLSATLKRNSSIPPPPDFARGGSGRSTAPRTRRCPRGRAAGLRIHSAWAVLHRPACRAHLGADAAGCATVDGRWQVAGGRWGDAGIADRVASFFHVHGIRIQRVLTDKTTHGPTARHRPGRAPWSAWAQLAHAPRLPARSNGTAERFHRALFGEWACISPPGAPQSDRLPTTTTTTTSRATQRIRWPTTHQPR